jgi:hypothetical protein
VARTAKNGVTAEEIIRRRKSGRLPEVTSEHIGLAHHWRRQSVYDHDVRLADDICRIIEAVHSPVSSHILAKRKKSMKRFLAVAFMLGMAQVASAQSITVSPKTATVAIGTTKKLTRTVTTVWTSSDPTVAAVSSTGLVTPKKQGVTTISVTSGPGVVATSIITVPPPPVASVQVILGKSTLVVGEKTSANVVLRDALGNILAGRVVTWSSSNPGVATVMAAPLAVKVQPQRYSFDWVAKPNYPWQKDGVR